MLVVGLAAAVALLSPPPRAGAQAGSHEGCRKLDVLVVKLGAKTLLEITVCDRAGGPPAPPGATQPSAREPLLARPDLPTATGPRARKTKGADRDRGAGTAAAPAVIAPVPGFGGGLEEGARGARGAPSAVTPERRRGGGSKRRGADGRRSRKAVDDGGEGVAGGAIPAVRVPLLELPTAASGEGWAVSPLPIFGVLLLALGGGWLLVMLRSERPVLAGAGGALVATGRGRMRPVLTRRELVEGAAVAALVVVSVVAIQAFVARPVLIPSASMAPTLAVGEQIVMERVSLRFGAPQRGDVIVFKPPAGADEHRCGALRIGNQACARPTPGHARGLYIKRVVAGPGERVRIVGGRAYVDGRLRDEPAIRGARSCATCNLPREITVPAGHYFLMGDNRGESVDSRVWGPVPREDILGRARFTFWPPGRIGPV